MKIRAVLVGVKLESDQPPKTPVIHKVGGYGSGSDIRRGLHALADAWDGGDARPTSFSAKLCGIRQKAKILHNKIACEVIGGRVGSAPPLAMKCYCASPFRSPSANSQTALLSVISSSMPVMPLDLG